MTTAGTVATEAPPSNRGWNVGLWIVQVLLALAFGMAGLFKSTTPIAELAHKMAWTATVPAALVRFIGISELAGAVGLTLPALTRIQPRLTPIAAIGLTLVMILAVAFHVSRGEVFALPVAFVLGGLAALVAWGRLRKAPIKRRS